MTRQMGGGGQRGWPGREWEGVVWNSDGPELVRNLIWWTTRWVVDGCRPRTHDGARLGMEVGDSEVARGAGGNRMQVAVRFLMAGGGLWVAR